MKKQFSMALTAAAFGLMMVGCCATKPLNVTVELDEMMRDKLAARSIQVDIVALNSKQTERWKDYSMSSYWGPNDPLRDSVPTYKMIFSAKSDKPQTLSDKDEIWKKWLANAGKDKMKLYVLALLPGSPDDQPGDTDPRRQILPLDSCRWAKDTVKMKIQKTGIITVTPPKPEK